MHNAVLQYVCRHSHIILNNIPNVEHTNMAIYLYIMYMIRVLLENSYIRAGVCYVTISMKLIAFLISEYSISEAY